MDGGVLQVLRSGPGGAAENMALDEAMLDYVLQNAEADGTAGWLRLYGWRRPAVSFGRYQRAERQVDLTEAAAAEVDLVRRPTGGKALIHHDEVTYCVVVPPSSPLASWSVAESHRRLAAGLVRALASLGVTAQVGRLDGSGDRGAAVPCFAEHLAESVLVDGRKVAGSAQLRRGGAVLQHGSLLLSIDHALHRRLFGAGADGFAASAVGLNELVRPPSRRLVEDAVEGGMAAVVAEGRRRTVDVPPPWMAQRSRRLAAETYTKLDWPTRREEGQA